MYFRIPIDCFMNMTLTEKLTKIKLIVMDVDGVLTDGGIILGNNHQEFKRFDVQDGFGLVLAREAGLKTAVITGKKSDVVQKRMADLRIDYVYQNMKQKLSAFDEILGALSLSSECVCAIGDDLLDIPMMNKAGVAVAVANARTEVKKAACYVTKTRGGYGAVREVIETILKSQNKWQDILQRMYS